MPTTPLPNRKLSNTLVDLMGMTGMALSVLALGAGLGEGIDSKAPGSWAILEVAVVLIIFEVCAVFWGPSGRLAFVLQAVIQLALLSTFLYAALTHRDHAKAHYLHYQMTPDQTKARTAGDEAKKELDSGHPDRALRLFDEAIRLDPTYATAYVSRGILHANLGQTKQAIEDYDAAIRINQKDAVAYFDRAIAYNKLGLKERAIQDYSEAIRLNPRYSDAYDNRGLLYRALGKTKQAQSDFDKAKELRAAK